tara:strand:+ start:84 stop:1385 length:1302 start_codon:yes stop_codon:yes gene_type:complete
MSFTGLRTINATDINLDGEIRLTSDLLPGTAGQVLQSQGETLSATWANPTATATPNPLTMGTNVSLSSGNASWDGSIADTLNSTDTNTQLNLTGGNGIDIANTGGLNRTITTDNDGTTINNTGGTGSQNQVLKVPNALTAGTNISFSVGTTYDGSAGITINSTDTDTTYQAGDGIEIDTSTNPDTISAKPDEDTIDFDGDELAVQKVPNGLSAGTNLSFSSGSTFDGASVRTINLDTSISGMINITFVNTGTSSSITGSSYPGNPTTTTNLDLTDSSNIVSPYCFHTIYDPALSDFDALSTGYTAVFLSNVNTTITAKATALCVELLCFNYGSTSNRFTYCRLADASGLEWSAGTNQGGSGTGTLPTNRLVHGMDETDKQIFRITWHLKGLTKGSTYTFQPQARTSGTFNYLAAGGSYPATILRGYYLPSAGI